MSEEEQPGLDAAEVGRSAEPGSQTQVEASRPQFDTDPTEAGTAASVAAEAPAAAVGTEEPAKVPTTRRAEETSPASPRTKAAETPVKPASARRKKVEPIVEPTASVGTALEESPDVAAGPKSFADEMADLDAEVAALRRQLGKRLVEQNAQLRQMLARFDVR
ncbi:hypothetical protein FHX15_005955 [Rhizobium sp. BK650]|uniref:hypothetical protein n=1 Tax=Rhizobium sp. BK650 TaxID=2586990 RepID=UPI0016211495|nr:hypothetical protein [Rhizobium sp. BK650]MBB3660684.1 hypothetical protein [Rhizobium sp. BK650]